MTKARIVHLATHGLLDDYKQLGVPGAIALAPDPQKTNEDHKSKIPNGVAMPTSQHPLSQQNYPTLLARFVTQREK